MPTDPIYSRLLVIALKPDYATVKESICTIVAMLSVENVFYGSSNAGNEGTQDKQKNRAIKRRKRLLNGSSDHLSLLQVYDAVMIDQSAQTRQTFCNEHLINFKAL